METIRYHSVAYRARKLCCVTFLGMSLVLLAAIPNGVAQAPAPPTQPITLAEAVNYALGSYPAARSALERVIAARATVKLAQTAYLPRTDLLWQSNRATYNNIPGLLLPQSVVPPLSGPVLANTSTQTAWGSVGGALFSWEPFDFGLRSANVNAARQSQNTVAAQLEITRLDVAAAAADAFLGLVVAQEIRRAAQADVDRRKIFADAVHVLVDNQLRPGVDASRADAELAAARNQLIRAQQTESEAHIGLAQALGIAGNNIEVRSDSLLSASSNASIPAGSITKNPSVNLAKSQIEEVRARERQLDRTYYPRFYLQSAVSGRGSGVLPTGVIETGSAGLAPERYNWAVGFNVTFPLFDIFPTRFRKQAEAANERAARAQYDQTTQQLTAQLLKAQTATQSAKRIAENTAIELKSAQQNETQAEARYRAALTTLIEVSDAQRLLVQAETDDAVAKLSVWRALLSTAFAQGDLQPFLDTVHETGGH